MTWGTTAGLGAKVGQDVVLIVKNTLAAVLKTDDKGPGMEAGRPAIIQVRDG